MHDVAFTELLVAKVPYIPCFLFHMTSMDVLLLSKKELSLLMLQLLPT
jgi:hypothetical protein